MVGLGLGRDMWLVSFWRLISVARASVGGIMRVNVLDPVALCRQSTTKRESIRYRAHHSHILACELRPPANQRK